MNKLLILILVIAGIAFRFYKIDNPIADWHSFRQADTASVTKNLLNGKGSFLIPTYHDLSEAQSGKQNPKGYRMVEVPIYNQITKFFIQITNLPIDFSHRLINIILSIATALVLYKISKSLYTLVLALFLPYIVFYNHAILPETTGIFLFSLCLYFLHKKNFFLSNIFLGLSLLIKPFFGFLIAPVWIYSFLKADRKQKILAIISALLVLLPFYFWRQHISKFPEGIPFNLWLYQGFPGEPFTVGKPYWFRWLFYERLTVLISGFGLLFPFLLGHLKNKINIFYSLGILIYFSIMARGNVHHDYYQVITMPFFILITTAGLKLLRPWFAFILIAIGFFFSWQKIKEYYKINRPEIIFSGWVADNLLPKDAVVIVPYQGDTAFLYQTKRDGFPIEIYEPMPIFQERYKNKLFYVSVNYDTYTNNLLSKYQPVYKTKDLLILDLNKPIL